MKLCCQVHPLQCKAAVGLGDLCGFEVGCSLHCRRVFFKGVIDSRGILVGGRCWQPVCCAHYIEHYGLKYYIRRKIAGLLVVAGWYLTGHRRLDLWRA